MTRHWTAYRWTACLAILFNAFVPIVSQSFGAPQPQTVDMEVCTALGMKMMSMLPEEPGRSASDKQHKSLSHCAYCTVHAGALGLPPHPSTVIALAVHWNVYPTLYYQSPRPLFLRSQTAPAPPFLGVILQVRSTHVCHTTGPNLDTSITFPGAGCVDVSILCDKTLQPRQIPCVPHELF